MTMRMLTCLVLTVPLVLAQGRPGTDQTGGGLARPTAQPAAPRATPAPAPHVQPAPAARPSYNPPAPATRPSYSPPAPAARPTYSPPAPAARPTYSPPAQPTQPVPQDTGARPGGVITTRPTVQPSRPSHSPPVRPSSPAPSRPSVSIITSDSGPGTGGTRPTGSANSGWTSGGVASPSDPAGSGRGWTSHSPSGDQQPSRPISAPPARPASSSWSTPRGRSGGLASDVAPSGSDKTSGLRPTVTPPSGNPRSSGITDQPQPARPSRGGGSKDLPRSSAPTVRPASGWTSPTSASRPKVDVPPAMSGEKPPRTPSSTVVAPSPLPTAVRPQPSPLAPVGGAAPVAQPAMSSGASVQNSGVVVVSGGTACLPAVGCTTPWGASPWNYCYQPSSWWSTGCWDPCWNPCSWTYSPVWCTPSWCFSTPSWSWVSWCRPSWRLSVGFGWSSGNWYSTACAPTYYSCSYYPWSYYCATGYYPAWSTVQYETIVVDRTESMDPYVSYDDAVVMVAAPTAVSVRSIVPVAFHQPFTPDFPEGLSASECLARGEGWLRSREYLLASEAFRKAWVQREDDAFACAELGVALSAAGRYELAATALQTALSLDAGLATRMPDLCAALIEKGRLGPDVIRPLQEDLVRNPGAIATAYVLACAQLADGDPWSAQRELADLKAAGCTHASLETLARASASTIAASSGR